MTTRLWLVRHGETDWSAAGQHTGRTDVPLNATGREQAERVGRGLASLQMDFAAAYCSPLSRARETAKLAGFPDATPMDDLVEWDYGEFEGRRTVDIRHEENEPHWFIWNADIREGESTEAVGERADQAREALLRHDGEVIVFAHGHFLRMFAARWMGLAARMGQHLTLATGTLSILGHEHDYQVIERWNTPANPE
jgi:probable phosphoglycerate mutase